jgi:hypothetical protein
VVVVLLVGGGGVAAAAGWVVLPGGLHFLNTFVVRHCARDQGRGGPVQRRQWCSTKAVREWPLTIRLWSPANK